MQHTYETTHTLTLTDAEYRTLRDVAAHHEQQSGGACTKEWAAILQGFDLNGCHDPESDTWFDAKGTPLDGLYKPSEPPSKPERAQVGDVVKLHPNFHPCVMPHLKVVEAGHSAVRLENGQCASHGNYTIVSRATESAAKPDPTTTELVDMLAKREGVREIVVDPHGGWEIATVATKGFARWETRDGAPGPTRILVVTD